MQSTGRCYFSRTQVLQDVMSDVVSSGQTKTASPLPGFLAWILSKRFFELLWGGGVLGGFEQTWRAYKDQETHWA